jgi:hypothetical protein
VAACTDDLDIPLSWDSCLKAFRGHASGWPCHHVLFLTNELMFSLTFLTRNLTHVKICYTQLFDSLQKAFHVIVLLSHYHKWVMQSLITVESIGFTL